VNYYLRAVLVLKVPTAPVQAVPRSIKWGTVVALVPAGPLAPTLGEPVPSQLRGDTWIRVIGDRIQSVRNGHWLSQGKDVLLTHISNHSGGDPLVIAP